MKIALIGPAYPFRGGISHYTTLLYGNLLKKHQVRFYTFKRPYPKMLFPGDASNDPSRMQLSDIDVIPSVDWANPFSWFETALSIARWLPDIIIFPWWMWGWAIPFFVIGRIVSLKADTKILYICHNIIEHETSYWKGILSRFALSIGDYFIVHSQRDYTNLKSIMPEAKVRVSFHPTYEVFRNNGATKESARSKLGIDNKFKKVLLFFGIVRPYKGLNYLIEAMPKILAEFSDLCLIIAGEFWEQDDNYLRLIEELRIEDAVKVISEYIPNEEVSLYFSATDVVILPYVSGTGSGIVQIAFGFNKPVIATKVGCLPEVVTHGKTGYLLEPNNATAIAKAVISFYKMGKESSFVSNIAHQKHEFSWDGMVKAIESIQ